MNLYIKKLRNNAIMPQRATSGSAGYDLSACLDKPLTINKGEIVKVPTGISIAPDNDDVVVLIYARSSLATKFGIAPANCVGVVDSDYRGEIMVALLNSGSEPYTISPAERIAQMVITPVYLPQIIETQTLDETDRGEGGFGSTGKL